MIKRTKLRAALIVCFFALSAYQYSAFALDQPSDLKIPDEKSTAKTKEYFKQGDSLLQAGDFKKAVTEFSKALEFNPQYADAYLGRGDAYAGMEKAEEAIKDYSRYLELRPKDTFGYLKRASAYSFGGNCQKAIEDYDKVIKEFPKEANLYFSRGTCYELLNKKEQAVEDYKTAAELGYGPAQEVLQEMGVK